MTVGLTGGQHNSAGKHRGLANWWSRSCERGGKMSGIGSRRVVVAAAVAILVFQAGTNAAPTPTSASARSTRADAAPRQDTVSVVVPYGAPGWKVRQIAQTDTPPSGWETNAFDEVQNGFTDSSAAFGSGGGCGLGHNGSWAVGTDLLVRRYRGRAGLVRHRQRRNRGLLERCANPLADVHPRGLCDAEQLRAHGLFLPRPWKRRPRCSCPRSRR